MTANIGTGHIHTLDGNIESILFTIKCMKVGSITIEYWNLLITEGHVIGSYKGESFRSFLLRWSVDQNSAIGETNEGDVLKTHLKNFSIKGSEIKEVILRKGSFIKHATIVIKLVSGDSLHFSSSNNEELSRFIKLINNGKKLRTSFSIQVSENSNARAIKN